VSFVYPWFLLLFVLLAFFYVAKKSSKLEQVFSKEILTKLQFGTFGNKNFKSWLLILAFSFMIIALARPVFISNDKKEVSVESFNFVIALDISKSMEADDVFPNRLEFAKKAIFELMSKTSEANIAVIAYANDAFLVSPFSNDFKSIKFLLSNLDTSSLVSKGSQILSALKATTKVFESTNDKKRSLLLVSDGADGRDLKEIEEYLKKHNITLYVLAIGTKKGTTLSDGRGGLIKDKSGNIVVSKRDDSISKVLNGGSLLGSSGDLSKLDWLAEEIRGGVDKKELKRDRFEGSEELFYYPLSLSLVLLFFAFFSIRAPFLLVLFFVQVDSHAGIFDFVDIYDAKKSYENKEYEKAEKKFGKIDTQSALYNKANALYKQERYDDALKIYKTLDGFSIDKEHKRLHNIGNVYAKTGETDKAIKSYKKALEIQEDEDTKVNLELMKKKKKKEEQKKKEKKKDEGERKEEKKDGEESDKKEKESDKKEQKKSQGKPEEEPRKMSEVEAKKWEKRMNDKEFKTKPMRLKRGEQNEITW